MPKLDDARIGPLIDGGPAFIPLLLIGFPAAARLQARKNAWSSKKISFQSMSKA
jgi:hypothetical protein